MQTANATVGAATRSPIKDLPLLRHGATVVENNGQVAIRHLRDEVTLEGATAQLFTKLGPYLDGKTTLETAGAKVSEAPSRVRGLLERLEKAGVVAFLSADGDGVLMSGIEFHKLHR